MIFSITAISYLIFSLALGLLCYRFFRYWQEEKSIASKTFLSAGTSLFLFSISTTIGLLFFLNNPYQLKILVYIATFLQSISFSTFAYFIIHIKFPKISPWFGVIPIFILGLVATFLNKIGSLKPYMDSLSAVNWGIYPSLYPSLFLRTFLLLITFVPIIIILLRQFKDVADPYIKKKTLIFIIFFIIGLLIALLDLIIINILKIGAIWRDIGFIILSIVLIFTAFLTGDKKKNINVE